MCAGMPTSCMQNASYFHHLVSWWEHRADPNVLFLFYEGLISIPSTIHLKQVWNYNKEDLSRPDLDLAKGQAVRVGQLYQVNPKPQTLNPKP